MRGRCDSADFLLHSGFWMDAFMGLEAGEQPEKVLVPWDDWVFLPGIWDCDGSLSESVDFTTNFKKNVRKNVEIRVVLRYTVSSL